MVGNKPEHWRIITPIIGFMAFISAVGANIASWSVQHTVEDFQSHLSKLDDKFDKQYIVDSDLRDKITLVQGQCCRRSIADSQSELTQ